MDCDKAYQQCLDRLKWATHQLEIEVEDDALLSIADLIVQPMTGPWRYFHTPEHIFDVGGTEDPIEVLAALFHDVVYVQVDRSINFNLSYYIASFVKEVQGQLRIRDAGELPDDRMFEMVLSVFGFAPARVLSPMAGQNEFLSALVAVKALESILKLRHLTEIAACIEATIPFRKPSPEGRTVSEELFDRIKTTNAQFDLHLSEEEIVNIVKRAVQVSNRDVIGFAHPNSAIFLDNTWNLLPETNHNLVNSNSYTVREYRSSLQKMEGFMNFLTPQVVFRQFRGEPDDATYQKWMTRAKENIEVARLYLGSKLFAIACVEALSLRVGLDIPVSTMMGELPSQSPEGAHFEDYIPEILNAYPPKNDLEKEVLTLLEEGRNQSSIHDIKHSPIATFMVKVVGFDEIRIQLDRAKKFFDREISPEDFLAGCNKKVTEVITNAVVKVFDCRKSALQR
ncbi:MAG: hypothetical protein SWY16_02575 [Cyanobacteriota bacterium]|nr:hypothetical protein [Cyanobacteriota bacterium]